MTPDRPERPPAADSPSRVYGPPPKRSLADKVMRFRGGLEGFSNLIHFLIVYVSPIVAGYAALFVANGIWNKWRIAYDVNLAIISPASNEVRLPWLALPLSLAGWLVVPVVAGAVVGYAVNASLERRRATGEVRIPAIGSRRRGSERSQRALSRFEPIPYLRDRGYTMHHGISDDFVNYFLDLHDGDWKSTEQHFSLEVRDNLNRDVVRARDPQGVAMRLAVKASVKLLWETRGCDLDVRSAESDSPPASPCPHCPSDSSLANGNSHGD